MFKPLIVISALALASLASVAMAQTAQPMRLRATVEKVEPGFITVKERSGEVVKLVVASDMSVTEVYAIDIAEIKADSYIGAAATPGKDGTLDAVEVLVFPVAMRGSGEGHRPWDLLPEATMTNAAVDGLSSSPTGRTIKLKYKDGEKTLNVPLNVPIVTIKPGDNTLLVTGAKVIVTAEMRDGKPTATRVLAGRNGFAPPM